MLTKKSVGERRMDADGSRSGHAEKERFFAHADIVAVCLHFE